MVHNWWRNKLQSRYFYWTDNLRFFYLPYFLHTATQNCCATKYLIFPRRIKLSVLSIQRPLHSNKLMKQILKEALQNHMTLCWILTSTHKHHIISIQYPSHKCLPEKSCLHCLRILIMSWLFKDPVIIMKEITSWLFKDPIVTVVWLKFHHARSNSKKLLILFHLDLVGFYTISIN